MARQVRIAGLVRAAEVIRREISAPLSIERRERLRKQVENNVQHIRRILETHRAQPNDLPAPSRRAYEFLTSVEWGKVTVDDSKTAPDAPRTVFPLRGLSSLIERVASLLSRDMPVDLLTQTSEILRRESRQVELSIERNKLTPDRMSSSSREQRAWIAYFALPENLNAYVRARKMANTHIDTAANGSSHYPPPVAIQFRHVGGSMYRLRETRHDGTVLSLPTPMIAFDPAMFAVLGELIYRRDGRARQRVIDAMTAEPYQSIRAELEALAGVVEQTRGATHDLAASFDRVNAVYFAGKMARPHLTWNRTMTGRKFGHYDFIHDTVMVSRTLDAPGVPEFVVDYLMFHELLHKFHGLHWVNGRGYAHTLEFSQSERTFARFTEADDFLRQLAR